MAHIATRRMIGDKVRIVAGAIAGQYYEGGIYRPDLGKHIVECHNRATGRKDLVNIRRGTVTPLVRGGAQLGRRFA